MENASLLPLNLMPSLPRTSILAASLLLAVTSTLTACKTDTATHQTEQLDRSVSPAGGTSASLASPSDTRPLLICFGDSLTAGYGTEAGQTYPDYLQADLDMQGFRYRVVNDGVSGETTKDGLNRVASIIAEHPALVIVEFGGNDGLRGLRIEDSRANLDAILARLNAATPKIKVVLAGIMLPPDYGPDYNRQFNQTYVLLAKKYSVSMLPFLLQDVYGVPGMMQADNTHATPPGNAIVARNVLPLVTPLLKR